MTNMYSVPSRLQLCVTFHAHCEFHWFNYLSLHKGVYKATEQNWTELNSLWTLVATCNAQLHNNSSVALYTLLNATVLYFTDMNYTTLFIICISDAANGMHTALKLSYRPWLGQT